MWNQLRNLLRVTPRSESASTARPARLRPSLELLESRALLSVAPAGQMAWFELGNQAGASVQLPAAQDISIAVNFSAKYQLPTDILTGGISQGSVKQTDVTTFVPDPGSQDGGMVELGSFHENFHSDLYSSQPTDLNTPDTTDPLPTLQYMPRSVPMGTANNNGIPGSVVFGEAAAISATVPSDATPRTNSKTTNGLFDATAKSVPTGQSENASVEASQGASRLPVAESSTRRQAEESDGGMITLSREPVLDESADNPTLVQDEDPSTLEIPLEVERTYGRFQAFEVSTAEEIGSDALGDEEASQSTARPVEHHGEQPAATPVLKSAANHRVKAVDALFALASSVDEILDQDELLEQADGRVIGVIGDAPAADIQASKSTTDETRDSSMTPTRAFSSLPVSTAAAAVVFAAITRTTRRPRRRDEELGLDRD